MLWREGDFIVRSLIELAFTRVEDMEIYAVCQRNFDTKFQSFKKTPFREDIGDTTASGADRGAFPSFHEKVSVPH